MRKKEKNMFGEQTDCYFATMDNDDKHEQMICSVYGGECMYKFMPVARGCKYYAEGMKKYNMK